MMRWILLPVEATHFVRFFRIPRLRCRPFIFSTNPVCFGASIQVMQEHAVA